MEGGGGDVARRREARQRKKVDWLCKCVETGLVGGVVVGRDETAEREVDALTLENWHYCRRTHADKKESKIFCLMR